MLFRYIEPPFPPLRLIKDNRVVSCQYEDPFFPSSFIFEATLLPGAEYVLYCIMLTRVQNIYNLHNYYYESLMFTLYCNVLRIPTRTLKPRNYGSGEYFPVLGFKPRERQHPYSTPPSAKRTIQ